MVVAFLHRLRKGLLLIIIKFNHEFCLAENVKMINRYHTSELRKIVQHLESHISNLIEYGRKGVEKMGKNIKDRFKDYDSKKNGLSEKNIEFLDMVPVGKERWWETEDIEKIQEVIDSITELAVKLDNGHDLEITEESSLSEIIRKLASINRKLIISDMNPEID